MSVTPRRPQRTALTALMAAAVLAGPVLGRSPAFAGSPEPGPTPSVMLLNDYGAISSTRFDGVGSTVQLLAQVVDPAHQVASVRFLSTARTPQDTSTTMIGTVTKAPYTLAWTPDGGEGEYLLIVQALGADGRPLAEDTTDTTVSASASSVHLTGPTSGSALALGPEHTVQVTGTRSADLPALEVGALVWGRSGEPARPSSLVAVAAGSRSAGQTPDTWAAVVTVPACADRAGCFVDVVAFAGKESTNEGASSFGVETEPIARTVTPGINGAAAQSAPYAGTFQLTGTAPAGSRVTLHLHRQGAPAGDYSLERTVVADAAGVWTRPIAATADYRVYVTSAAYGRDAARSTNVCLVVAPTVDGARIRVVPRDAVTTLTGWAAPGSVVALQVHRAGRPAASYALEQSVRAAANGRWSLTRTATGDVRVLVTRAGGSSSAVGQPTFLIQAR